ncbi:hypothetical protein QF042_000717 [Pedobacter sp. W3I1]|nr:hypothetical protein [Pedobacter sp. W3I1]
MILYALYGKTLLVILNNQEMNAQCDFGNSSPVIRYSSDKDRRLPLLSGLETKVCAINSKLPIGPSTPLRVTTENVILLYRRLPLLSGLETKVCAAKRPTKK